MPRYDPQRIESHWQAHWDEHKTFEVANLPGEGPTYYALDMFPYPSGNGLHVGHPEGYTATDIVCRYKRMTGFHVLHPMGWDAFGLPAEQHAIKTGTHPAETTKKNIDTFRRQLKMLGFSYDWSREVGTCFPDYYRWTQWIFLELFDTWYDAACEWTGPDGKKRTGRGRPIADFPIPDDVQAAGEEAVRRYQDARRLAYQHEAPVNWCSALNTVLANEEIIDGKSERGGHPVERIPLRQWMLGITRYGDRLIDELEDLDWSESIKSLQRNWIGRSEGAEVDFYIGADQASGEGFDYWKAARTDHGFPEEPSDDVLRVYTTRPDTLYGATYMVLAPEHPFVDRLTTPEQKEAVEAYRYQASLKSDLDRTDLAKGKTGVFSGSYAFNPINGAQTPIWIADYVLISYGTGAIMAVPAHDLRDWEFAVQFEIPIVQVVAPPEGYEPSKDEKALALPAAGDGLGYPFSGEGTAVNSGDDNNGLETSEFKQKISAELHTHGLGQKAVNYRLRDWLFSRQHFWGEPFPIWHELDADGNRTGLMRGEEAASLPALLPDNFDFKPHGRPDPPLEEAPESWLYKTAEDDVRLKRETNTMPQWAGSCWYYLRYLDPKNEQQFIDPEIEQRWMPVDLYIGGAEHAVLHLLYARFWHKVLFDRGHVSTCEPFHKLVNQGMILGDAELTGFKAPSGDWVSLDDIKSDEFDGERVALEDDQVEKNGDKFVLKENPGIVVEIRAFKMSKARGNVINPDVVVEQYGADSLRLYEMFMGPLEQMKPWNMQGVEGIYRFLGRVWRMFVDDRADEVTLNGAVMEVEPNADQLRTLHHTIKAVTDDIEKLSFNTAISRMMEFTNDLSPQKVRPRAILEPFVLLLSPFAPHLAEELWQLLGHEESLAYAPWPVHDDAHLVESEVEIAVQVNGKLRAKVKVPAEADQPTIEAAARADETIAKNLDGKNVVKVIVVPGRLVNFVVKG
jgi:leucyl-tRNA synthetase